MEGQNHQREWVRTPGITCQNLKRPHRKLTCRQALKADALHPKSQRRAAKVLLAQIKPEGYVGSSLLTAFIRAWRGQQGIAGDTVLLLTEN